MQNSKKLMEKAGILPRLRLGNKGDKGVISTGPHRVKLLADRIVRDMDVQTNKEIEFVEYSLEENGEPKTYRTKLKDKQSGLSYLVQRMAEVAEGSEVILEMKRQGARNFVSVTPVSGDDVIEVDGDDHTDDEVIEVPE